MFLFLFFPNSTTFPFQMLTFVCPPLGGLQTAVGSRTLAASESLCFYLALSFVLW